MRLRKIEGQDVSFVWMIAQRWKLLHIFPPARCGKSGTTFGS
jgi:hypothetical protein